jgi:Zn-dependent peptidase ImmA (M78 family)
VTAPDVREAILSGVAGATEMHDAFQLRERYEEGDRAIDVFSAITDLAIPLRFDELDGLLGACVRVDSASAGILVTTQRPLNIQRFTAAHELGHFVLDHERSFDYVVGPPTRNEPILEVEANTFAAEFLMPKWLLRATASRRGWWGQDRLEDPDVVYQLSLRLGVSFEATCWGLSSAAFISRGTATALADKKPKEIKQRALNGVKLEDSWANVWVLGEGDADSQLNAGPNDIFIVELEERAASGFRWDAKAAVAAGFRVLDDGNQFSDRRVGAASTRRLVFAAAAAGEYELELSHRRSFSTRNTGTSIRFSISTQGSIKKADVLPAGVTLH